MIRTVLAMLREQRRRNDKTPHRSVTLGSRLMEIGRQAELTDAEFAVFEQIRAKERVREVSFE